VVEGSKDDLLLVLSHTNGSSWNWKHQHYLWSETKTGYSTAVEAPQQACS